MQDQSQTMLIHTQHWWPKTIDAHLWPYALRVANEDHNSTPTIGREDHKSPFELFARSEVTPNLNHFQPFGCPVFVLDNKMQSGQKLPKWEVRLRVGVCLGMSMQHARSVALVPNPKTGHVSPQFHVTFDHRFETVRQVPSKSISTFRMAEVVWVQSLITFQASRHQATSSSSTVPTGCTLHEI